MYYQIFYYNLKCLILGKYLLPLGSKTVNISNVSYTINTYVYVWNIKEQ